MARQIRFGVQARISPVDFPPPPHPFHHKVECPGTHLQCYYQAHYIFIQPLLALQTALKNKKSAHSQNASTTSDKSAARPHIPDITTPYTFLTGKGFPGEVPPSSPKTVALCVRPTWVQYVKCMYHLESYLSMRCKYPSRDLPGDLHNKSVTCHVTSLYSSLSNQLVGSTKVVEIALATSLISCSQLVGTHHTHCIWKH